MKALGGEEAKFPNDAFIILPFDETESLMPQHTPAGDYLWTLPPKTHVLWGPFSDRKEKELNQTTVIRSKAELKKFPHNPRAQVLIGQPAQPAGYDIGGATQNIPGSSWGVFTIAATIPIALLVGLWMYKIRPGRTVEASIIGAVLVLGATVLGGTLKDSSFAHFFDLTQTQVTWAMAVYGFVAAVLPVWLLLAPRDYLSTFLKIGTIGVLVLGVIVANPKLEAPAMNQPFFSGGPVLGSTAPIFPFLFTTIMCGAISGFHSLVSSGTTSKMIRRERDARTIGYGAMLVEGLVGIVALIAAASLSPADYYAMNVDNAVQPQWHDRILAVGGGGGIEHLSDYETLAHEPLRGRTGGAVTLAVGMAHIFDSAVTRVGSGAKMRSKNCGRTGITSRSCSRRCSSSPPSTPAPASAGFYCRKSPAACIPNSAIAGGCRGRSSARD